MARAVGMDISAWQTSTPPLHGQDFAFVRAVYGDDKDVRYDQHVRNLKAAGVHVFAYAFGRHIDVASQVRAFIAATPTAELWCLDVESDDDRDTKAVEPSMTNGQAESFIARMQSSGRRCGLYVSRSRWWHAGQDFTWIADPNDLEWDGPWAFWQRSSGRPSGDVFDGTRAELEEWLGMTKLAVQDERVTRIRMPAGINVYDLQGKAAHALQTGRDVWVTGKVKVPGATQSYYVVPGKLGGDDAMTLVRVSAVTDLGLPPDSGPTPADVDAARAAGFDEAKGKALAAVEGI